MFASLARWASAFPPGWALRWATRNGYRALGIPDGGWLAPGNKADLIMVNLVRTVDEGRWPADRERVLGIAYVADGQIVNEYVAKALDLRPCACGPACWTINALQPRSCWPCMDAVGSRKSFTRK